MHSGILKTSSLKSIMYTIGILNFNTKAAMKPINIEKHHIVVTSTNNPYFVSPPALKIPTIIVVLNDWHITKYDITNIMTLK